MKSAKETTMASKPAKSPATKKPHTELAATGVAKPKGKTLARVPDAADNDTAAAMASMALRPSVNAAAVMMSYTSPLGEQDLCALVNGLANGVRDLHAGDMKRAEAMLYAQAHALQSIFMSFARRAQAQEYQRHLESFLRMALKAQNQCRMTLETLANIKNPPVVLARQANINNGGQQQVNNGMPPLQPAGSSGEAWSAATTPTGTPRRPSSGAGARAANSKLDQTELLEGSNGQRLDTGAQGKAGCADPHVEAVGAVHRPTHR